MDPGVVRIIMTTAETLKSKSNFYDYNKEDIELNGKAMYNKAIDDFVKAMEREDLDMYGVEKIADQLKKRLEIMNTEVENMQII